MKNLQKINNKNYKIVLKRGGRTKRPYYRIVVLNKYNRYRMDLGSVDLSTNLESTVVYINKLMLFYWLSKGAFCSLKVQYFLNYLLVDNK